MQKKSLTLNVFLILFKNIVWQHPYVNVFKHLDVASWKKATKEGEVNAIMVRYIYELLHVLYLQIKLVNTCTCTMNFFKDTLSNISINMTKQTQSNFVIPTPAYLLSFNSLKVCQYCLHLTHHFILDVQFSPYSHSRISYICISGQSHQMHCPQNNWLHPCWKLHTTAKVAIPVLGSNREIHIHSFQTHSYKVLCGAH